MTEPRLFLIISKSMVDSVLQMEHVMADESEDLDLVETTHCKANIGEL